MKALVYTGVKQVELRDVPDPIAGAGELLVRVDSVGICGSDMHGFVGHDPRRPAPLILGHEPAGIVVGGPRDGERVTVNPLKSCGSCRSCKTARPHLCTTRAILSMPPREGAFAEFITTPEENVVTVPDNVSLEKACLAEPIAVGWHAARLLDELASLPNLSDCRCLVIGGGAIGVTTALSLRAFSAQDITIAETNPLRHGPLEALALGPVINPTENAPADSDFDVVIDAVGYDGTRALACQAAAPGGAIAHIGLGGGSGGVDVRKLTLQEISFFGTYCYTPQDFRDCAQALFEGRLGALDWTESRPLADGLRAFEDVLAGRNAQPKLLLKPSSA